MKTQSVSMEVEPEVDMAVPDDVIEIWRRLPVKHQEVIRLVLHGMKRGEAWRTVYPECVPSSSYTNAWRLLKKAEVSRLMGRIREEACKDTMLGVYELQAFAARAIRATMDDIFDENGEPRHQSSDLIQGWQIDERTYTDKKTGEVVSERKVKVTLVSKLEAAKVALTARLNSRDFHDGEHMDEAELYSRITDNSRPGLPLHSNE